jgi:hypothetical protein
MISKEHENMIHAMELRRNIPGLPESIGILGFSLNGSDNFLRRNR